MRQSHSVANLISVGDATWVRMRCWCLCNFKRVYLLDLFKFRQSEDASLVLGCATASCKLKLFASMVKNAFPTAERSDRFSNSKDIFLFENQLVSKSSMVVFVVAKDRYLFPTFFSKCSCGSASNSGVPGSSWTCGGSAPYGALCPTSAGATRGGAGAWWSTGYLKLYTSKNVPNYLSHYDYRTNIL